MGVQVIYNSVQKARKEYDDMAYEFLCEMADQFGWAEKGKFSFADLRILVAIKQRRLEARMILPGDVYVRQRSKLDGLRSQLKRIKQYAASRVPRKHRDKEAGQHDRRGMYECLGLDP